MVMIHNRELSIQKINFIIKISIIEMNLTSLL